MSESYGSKRKREVNLPASEPGPPVPRGGAVNKKLATYYWGELQRGRDK
jgi:hypothetical protein